MITVVAALIARNSKLLVCQRRRDDSYALQWEFPGGKVEPGESLAEALVRELKEELGVSATIGKELFRTTHRYKDSKTELLLVFFEAIVDAAAPLQNFVFERFEWADPSILSRYNFLQADKEFVNLLATKSISIGAIQ
jgi:8-oxo-dGTP diphosphatase